MKGINFIEIMYLATVDQKKTQTRRLGGLHIVNENPDAWSLVGMGPINEFGAMEVTLPDLPGGIPASSTVLGFTRSQRGKWVAWFEDASQTTAEYIFPRYQPGEILYLKEPYRYQVAPDAMGYSIEYWYGSAYRPKPKDGLTWKNKLYMPADHARTYIKITSVRCERLWDITEADAIAEGIECIGEKFGIKQWKHYSSDIDAGGWPVISYRSLFEKINGKGYWQANPWVFVYDYQLIEKPAN